MSLTQTDLNQKQCGAPGCTKNHDVIFIHCPEHPRGHLVVGYHKADGTLRVICKECGEDGDYEDELVSILVGVRQ